MDKVFVQLHKKGGTPPGGSRAPLDYSLWVRLDMIQALRELPQEEGFRIYLQNHGGLGFVDVDQDVMKHVLQRLRQAGMEVEDLEIR